MWLLAINGYIGESQKETDRGTEQKEELFLMNRSKNAKDHERSPRRGGDILHASQGGCCVGLTDTQGK